MAQSQCNCKNCRRLIGIDTPKCPFCGTPNMYYKKNVPNAAPKSDIPHPAKKSAAQNGAKQDIQNTSAGEISIEEMESMYREPVPVKASPNKETELLSEADAEAQNTQAKKAESSLPVQDTSTISATQESHRSKIPWDDEQTQNDPGTYTEMFNEQGKYQANYDGYYNDTLPKIKDEIDKTLAGKEKTILKVFFSVMGIIAIIVFLILTN